MITNYVELRVSLQQMGRVIRAIGDLKDTVLAENPELFAVMAEGYVDDLDRLREEVDGYLSDLKTAG